MKQTRASGAIQLLFDFESAEIDVISCWHQAGLLRLALPQGKVPQGRVPQDRVLQAAGGEPFPCHIHRISLRTPSCASSAGTKHKFKKRKHSKTARFYFCDGASFR